MASRGQRAAIAAVSVALVALIALVYAPLRDHEYLDYDDMALIVWNPDIEVGSPLEALRIAFTRPQQSGYVPITTLSHQLDRALWGRDATGALMTNVVLHALASVLWLLALHRVTGRLAASAFAAAVFALHPLHVESVAWAIERKDVLSALFFAGVVWLYAGAVRDPESRGPGPALLVCFGLGLLSKPMLVTAPCVLLLLDFWPFRRPGSDALREKLPMFAMAAGVALLTISVQSRVGSFDFGTSVAFTDRVANAIDSLVHYLADAFWPSGLAAFHPHPGAALGAGRIAAGAALLAAISAAAFALRRSQPWWVVGWLWFVGMLVPVLGLIQVGSQARADRYTYLPLIGIALALGCGVEVWARSPGRRRVALAAAALSVAALCATAMHQIPNWRDSRALYERVRSVYPDAAFPELRLGMVEAIEGRFERAAPHLERAHALEPASAERALGQLKSLARAHAANGRHERARRTARWAIGFARRIGETRICAELEADLRRWESS